MTILLSPENPAPTPLPWLLLQSKQGNFFIASRGKSRGVIASAAFSEDAILILHAVHAHRSMRAALQLLKSKLHVDNSCIGVAHLSAHFNHEEFLMIVNALAIAEMEDRYEN